MKKIICYLLCFVLLIGLFTGCEGSQDKGKTYEEHLKEKYEGYQEMEYGLDITKKTDLVSICYSMWFTKILSYNSNPPNITEILAGNQQWGGSPSFHYWAEPALGYYRSDDKAVIRTHMMQLQEAGIDFIALDNTNASINWKNSNDWNLFISKPARAILDTIVEMRSEGLSTPYVAFWNKVNESEGWGVVDAIYEEFYSEEKWQDCFVYWEGKPFVMTTQMIDNPPENFTVRKMFGLKQDPGVSEWSFLNIENIPAYDADGYVEQMCVCAASQETYMSAPTAHGRNHGIFFYEQWLRAFEHRPKVITITWWNEWAAQRLYIESGPYGGQYHFTDAYNSEYSRDIEPMKGGHSDQYYKWMIEYIRTYKAGEECPRLVEKGY